jgi:hypothetical protein
MCARRTEYRYPQPVETPDGVFDTVHAAAQHYGILASLVSYRCRVGEQQRAGTRPVPAGPYTGEGPQADYRQWRRLSAEPKPYQRRVNINGVIYDSITAAARALGMDKGSVYYRLKREWPGFTYED